MATSNNSFNKLYNEQWRIGYNFSLYMSSMTLGSTQPLTEMSTRNLPGGKVRPAREADNLTAICEPIV
jgi:hypothetical protein